eukprot:10646484-Alexandrium_andersonii.AAC.1
MSQRILTVASLVYRKWASMRLSSLQHWIQEWTTEDMFGGVRGRSAEQAAWHLSAQLELSRARGQHMSASTVDVFKCFDQVSRELVVRLACVAGAPPAIMHAWHRVLADMRVVPVMADTIGTPFWRETGIPQGCPLSMAWLNLVLRPMMGMIRACGAIPRALADDINCYARGRGHWRRVKCATDVMHLYVRAMGGKVAHKKCMLFSTNAHVRM